MGNNAGVMYRCMDVQEIRSEWVVADGCVANNVVTNKKKPAGYPTGLIGKMQLKVLFII